MAIFQKLNDEGHTILMITHEPDIAEHAKRIIHIKDGKIIIPKGRVFAAKPAMKADKR